MLGGVIGGLIFSLITIFAKKAAPFTAPLYALCEGLFLGGISGYTTPVTGGNYDPGRSPDLRHHSLSAGGLSLGLIRATENFKLGVVAATGAIALLYLVRFRLGFFGHSMGFIHESGTVGILFSLVVVVVAALNLVLDFDFIEQGVARRSRNIWSGILWSAGHPDLALSGDAASALQTGR